MKLKKLDKIRKKYWGVVDVVFSSDSKDWHVKVWGHFGIESVEVAVKAKTLTKAVKILDRRLKDMNLTVKDKYET